MLNATLWQQGSAEYIGVVNQAWLLAHDNLDKALADPQWTAAIEQTGNISNLPPAIMLDLDETVLDNSVYEARIIKQLGQYTPGSPGKHCPCGHRVEGVSRLCGRTGCHYLLLQCTQRETARLHLAEPACTANATAG